MKIILKKKKLNKRHSSLSKKKMQINNNIKQIYKMN